MTKIAIIIPSRLDAVRLPNKPLKLINNKEMILHVLDVATSSDVENVFVATPDQKIIDVVKNYGGQAVLTSNTHQTGTDRVFEVFDKVLKKQIDIIINLQGDMPNLNISSLKNIINHMKKNVCDICTLASKLKTNKEINDPDICKVVVDKDIEKNNYASALDFYRVPTNKNTSNTYHHIGIYGFTSKAIMRYVGLKRSKLEIERKLEQLRALEDKMRLDVCYIDACPLSVDNENDLNKIKKIMETK